MLHNVSLRHVHDRTCVLFVKIIVTNVESVTKVNNFTNLFYTTHVTLYYVTYMTKFVLVKINFVTYVHLIMNV